MTKTKFSEFKVGIFVLVAIILVLFVVFWTKGFIEEKDMRHMKVYFQNVSGLNNGDPVTVKGVKMGKVNSIEVRGDSVEINFSVAEDIKITNDYSIEIAVLELMGGKAVNIDPGKGTVEIDYNQPLKGGRNADVGMMFRQVNDLMDEVRALVAKFGENSDKINQVLTNVNSLVSDENVEGSLKTTLRNFEKTSVDLNVLVNENRVSLSNLQGKVGNTIDNVNTLIDESSPEFKQTFQNIETLTAKVDSLINNLNVIVTDVKDQKSGMGKFIYDEKFYDNINKTLLEIEKLTRKIRTDGVKINLF
ncbi:MAG TPA: MlaD family protein [Ignavibacteria bacterium]|nr:MlaD family protein [Ignavibacteria bacterium]